MANLTNPSSVLHTVLQEVNAMPNSTRLDKETEDALKKAADYLHMTKSDIVRKSVKEFCLRAIEERRKTAWEVYEAVHTAGGSGHGERVLTGKTIFGRQLEAKRKKWSL